jgi:hypothetical protein
VKITFLPLAYGFIPITMGGGGSCYLENIRFFPFFYIIKEEEKSKNQEIQICEEKVQ